MDRTVNGCNGLSGYVGANSDATDHNMMLERGLGRFVRRASPLFERINPPLLFPLPQGERSQNRPAKGGILLEKVSYVKRRRYPQHRQWREPSFREGQMVQFDTSDHDWHEFCVLRLEGRGPKLYLIGGVDDATGNVAGAKFVLTDGVRQNMEVFWGIIRRKGIPLSVYVDCGSNFKTTRYQSMEYQLIPPLAGPPNLPELWRN